MRTAGPPYPASQPMEKIRGVAKDGSCRGCKPHPPLHSHEKQLYIQTAEDPQTI